MGAVGLSAFLAGSAFAQKHGTSWINLYVGQISIRRNGNAALEPPGAGGEACLSSIIRGCYYTWDSWFYG